MKKLLICLILALAVTLLAAKPATPDSWVPIPIHQGEAVPYTIGDEVWEVYYYYFDAPLSCIVWRERYYPGYGWYQDGEITIGAGSEWTETWNTPRMACYSGSGWLVVSSTDASKRPSADPMDPCADDWQCTYLPQTFLGAGPWDE